MEERNKIYEQFYHSDLLYFLDFFPPDPALRARALPSPPSNSACTIMKFTRGGWSSRCKSTHTAAQRTLKCTVEPGGVAADAAAEVSAETAALIVGSNEDLVSYRAHAR